MSPTRRGSCLPPRFGTGMSASKAEVTRSGWLPDGPVVVGLTSGASTPDNLVEQVVRRLEAFTADAPIS